MRPLSNSIEIVSAPSILGLKPGGVEELSERLLAAGLAENLSCPNPVIQVPTLNAFYHSIRDAETGCLNAKPIRDFSLLLGEAVCDVVTRNHFAFVLGGDCSILVGAMSALKAIGTYGLIFLDAHADFYEPEKSITGEVADMDLALVTGRGPELLTNINNLKPYVKDQDVIHIGQRDWEETKNYNARDIRKTSIKCFDFSEIEKRGMKVITTEVLHYINRLEVEGFWIHFDTDVLADEINPAVDYRLPGGLQWEQVEYLLKSLLLTGNITGISVTIFNPRLDKDGSIARQISSSLGRAFNESPLT